jgi:hypothetical protein
LQTGSDFGACLFPENSISYEKLKRGLFMSNKNKDIASQVERSLYKSWPTVKQNFSFYSTTCKATPHGTPSPFALAIEEKRKEQSAPANNI